MDFLTVDCKWLKFKWYGGVHCSLSTLPDARFCHHAFAVCYPAKLLRGGCGSCLGPALCGCSHALSGAWLQVGGEKAVQIASLTELFFVKRCVWLQSGCFALCSFLIGFHPELHFWQGGFINVDVEASFLSFRVGGCLSESLQHVQTRKWAKKTVEINPENIWKHLPATCDVLR